MCCQITTPSRSIENHLQLQTFITEKLRDLIVTTRSCPGDKHISLNKLYMDVKILEKRFMKERTASKSMGK